MTHSSGVACCTERRFAKLEERSGGFGVENDLVASSILVNGNAFFGEQTLGNQGIVQFLELFFEVVAIDVEVFGISMALYTGGNLGFEGVVLAFAEVAAHAGVFHHGVVRAGFAFDAENFVNIEDAQHDVALIAEVGVEADRGGVLVGNDSARGIFGGEVGHVAASLVAVGAQVTGATVEGGSADNHRYWGGGLKRPVGAGASHMDLVAGAAVLAGRFGGASFKLGEVLASSNSFAEGVAGVTVSAAFVAILFCHRGAVAVFFDFPGSSLAGDEVGVIVALSASQVGRFASSASGASRAGRASGAGRTGRASRTGGASRACTGGQNGGGQNQHAK